MKLIITLALSVFALAPTCAAQGAGGREEWEALRKHFNEPGHYSLLVGGAWALTHGSGPKAGAEVAGLLKLFAALSEPFERQQVGGAAGFKEKAAGFLKSGDDAVRGFAATVLAVAGDRSYAPRVAELFAWQDPPEGDYSGHPLSSRGRAAVALGLLGAAEYKGKLAAMLGSPNLYDRAGASSALGRLGAREHAKAVAAIFADERFRGEGNEAAVHALFEMGVAAEYADVFASVVRDEPADGETAEAAAYALAALKSKRHAADVARLLGHKYRRGGAAKALAFMGAAEYAPRIARLLRADAGELDQSAALLALGVLGAKGYAPEAARILRARKESLVSHHAAEALVLLGADEYAAEVVPLLERHFREKLYLSPDQFHPLVEGEVGRLRRRFEEHFRKMQARRAR